MTTSRDRVWPFLVDPELLARWANGRVCIIEQGAGGPGGVGARREVLLAYSSGTIRLEQLIVESVPSVRLAWRLVSGMPLRSQRTEIALDEVPGGTRVVLTAEYEFNLPLLAHAGRQFLESIYVVSLDNLERILRELAGSRVADVPAP